jgi:hypothetical protein
MPLLTIWAYVQQLAERSNGRSISSNIAGQDVYYRNGFFETDGIVTDDIDEFAEYLHSQNA